MLDRFPPFYSQPLILHTAKCALNHGRFLERVERELVRARFSAAELALLLVAGDQPVERWLSRLATSETTAVAAYAAQKAEVLLAGAGAEAARRWVAAALPEAWRVGIALFPAHGAAAEDLLAAAGEALFRAASGERVSIATVVPLPAQLVPSEATQEVLRINLVVVGS